MAQSRFIASAICQAIVQILLLLIHDVIIYDTYSYSVWPRIVAAPLTFAIFTKYALPALDVALLVHLSTLLIDILYLLIWILPANSLAAAITSGFIIVVQYSIIQNVLNLKKSLSLKKTVKVPSLTQLRGVTIPFGTATFALAIFSGKNGLVYALRLVLQLDAFITHFHAPKKSFLVKLFEILTLIVDIACILNTFENKNKNLETVPLLLENGVDVFFDNLRSTLTVTTLVISLPCYILTSFNILQ